MTSKNFYFVQQKILLWLIVFHEKKERITIKNQIWFWDINRFIMTALGENIFRIALCRFAIALRDTEYIFSQLAVIRKS